MDVRQFGECDLVQDAVIRNFEIIGEASSRINTRFPEFAAAHPELNLVDAYRMRNVVAHEYFGVRTDVVWNTIHDDLPHSPERCLRHSPRWRLPRSEANSTLTTRTGL
jgi:uncharacterized protein with HEPN domain